MYCLIVFFDITRHMIEKIRNIMCTINQVDFVYISDILFLGYFITERI